MSQEELIRILSQNCKYFGEAANEFSISLRDIEFSGIGFLTAIRNLAHTTPSKEFANFAEDLTTVLRTGWPMSEYFRNKYEQYQEDTETQVLEQLAALAEGYVALPVAGPLFLITVLVIIGLLIGGAVGIIRGFVYVVLPLTSIGFMYYVGNLAASLGIDVDIDDHSLEMSTILDQTDRVETPSGTERPSIPATAADGGHPDRATDGKVAAGSHRENRRRLKLYNRFKSLHRSVVDPIRAIIDSPDTVLYVVTPVATMYVLVRTYLAFAGGTLSIQVVDDYLVQATLFVLSTFAVAEYLHSSQQEQIEDALPDFMDRLADQTGAGMTLTRSIRELDATSVPGLEQEIRELQTDISWGGRTS
jgi:flagellar protein FlaJ